MHGNASEMVLDNYRTDYEKLPVKDPVYLNGNDLHIVRGGQVFDYPGFLRSAARANPVLMQSQVMASTMRMVLAPEIKKTD